MTSGTEYVLDWNVFIKVLIEAGFVVALSFDLRPTARMQQTWKMQFLWNRVLVPSFLIGIHVHDYLEQNA